LLKTADFTGTQLLTAVSAVADPAAGEDVVGVALVADRRDMGAGGQYAFATFDIGQRGYSFYYPPGALGSIVVGDTTENATPQIPTVADRPSLLLLIIDRTGNFTIRRTETTFGTDVTPAGAIAHGNLAIGGLPGGTNLFNGRVAYVTTYVGTGIAASWNAAKIKDLYTVTGV
jgi:hypothetical protein